MCEKNSIFIEKLWWCELIVLKNVCFSYFFHFEFFSYLHWVHKTRPPSVGSAPLRPRRCALNSNCLKAPHILQSAVQHPVHSHISLWPASSSSRHVCGQHRDQRGEPRLLPRCARGGLRGVRPHQWGGSGPKEAGQGDGQIRQEGAAEKTGAGGVDHWAAQWFVWLRGESRSHRAAFGRFLHQFLQNTQTEWRRRAQPEWLVFF